MLSQFVLYALCITSYAAGVSRVLKDAPVEGLCDSTVDSYSGYFNVKSGVDKNYFYWFFESRSETQATDPLIVWLTGGPGCSSQLALLVENGPCAPTADGQGTVFNPWSWNSNANIMWVDQPANVGFSYGAPIVDMDHNEDEVSEDMYWFLQEFFNAHEEFRSNPLFIFGESYGGHFAPAVAHRIFRGNNYHDGPHINLAGLGVGNGLTDPSIQYSYYPEMAMNNTYDIKTVTEDAYSKMLDHVDPCNKLIYACQFNTSFCEIADDYCQMTLTMPYYRTGLNPYDIRKPCGDSDLCYDFDNVATFLNLPSTREALHVSEEVKEWVDCNTAVNAGFIKDWMKDYQQRIIPMLEDNIRVLIYAGDCDFICNWMGNKAWTLNLHWSGKENFNAAEDKEWKFTDSAGAERKSGIVRTAAASQGSGSLTFLQVFEAGHMVPLDQPEVSLVMLNTFLRGEQF